MAKSYLDKNGVTYLWTKIKAKFLLLSGGTVYVGAGGLNVKSS